MRGGGAIRLCGLRHGQPGHLREKSLPIPPASGWQGFAAGAGVPPACQGKCLLEAKNHSSSQGAPRASSGSGARLPWPCRAHFPSRACQSPAASRLPSLEGVLLCQGLPSGTALGAEAWAEGLNLLLFPADQACFSSPPGMELLESLPPESAGEKWELSCPGTGEGPFKRRLCSSWEASPSPHQGSAEGVAPASHVLGVELLGCRGSLKKLLPGWLCGTGAWGHSCLTKTGGQLCLEPAGQVKMREVGRERANCSRSAILVQSL